MRSDNARCCENLRQFISELPLGEILKPPSIIEHPIINCAIFNLSLKIGQAMLLGPEGVALGAAFGWSYLGYTAYVNDSEKIKEILATLFGRGEENAPAPLVEDDLGGNNIALAGDHIKAE